MLFSPILDCFRPVGRRNDDEKKGNGFAMMILLFPPFLFGFFDALFKIGGLNDFYLFSPSRQMPRHFQRAARAEFHGQRAVVVFDRFLSGVEDEVFRFGRGFRAEFPFDIVWFFAPDAESVLYILVHIEMNAFKLLFFHFNGIDVRQNEMMDFVAEIAVRVTRQQILRPVVIQNAVRLKFVDVRFSAFFVEVFNFDQLLIPDRRPDVSDDFGFDFGFDPRTENVSFGSHTSII